MRNRIAWITMMAALPACYTTAPLREPTVHVAPAYGVTLAHGTPDAGPPRVTPAENTTAPAPSVHYRASPEVPPFWRDLRDSTLTILITEALHASPSIRSAEARLTEARATRRLAALEFGPSGNASASVLRSQQSVYQVPGLSSQLPHRDLYDFGFDASWELDIFGRTRRTVSAQGALATSAAYGLEDVQVSLAAEVARTYFELRGAERQLAVARRNAENQRHTVSLTEDRLRAGRGTAFDTERARSVLQLTLASLPAIELQIAANRIRLGTLLGKPAAELPRAVYAATDLPPLPDSLAVGSPAELIRHRPDVLRAERLLAASALFAGAARADYLPRLSIGAVVGYTATRFQSLTSAGASRILIGPVVSLPLLDFGRVRERTMVAESLEDDARAQYDATILGAIEEAETSFVAYDRTHSRVAILTDAVRASAHATELAQQRFEAGLTDFFQVLDAQRTLLDAENQLAIAHTSAATALVAIFKAVGGRWADKP